jgi:hypothetical protein
MDLSVCIGCLECTPFFPCLIVHIGQGFLSTFYEYIPMKRIALFVATALIAGVALADAPASAPAATTTAAAPAKAVVKKVKHHKKAKHHAAKKVAAKAAAPAPAAS